MSRAKLQPYELSESLAILPDWELKEGCLTRTISFENFINAWGFMCQIALIAEEMNHHPDWRNVYSTVEIKLSTHDAGGITTLDFELAQKINNLL